MNTMPFQAATVEVDAIDEIGWNALVDGFDDASLYQTWAYEAAHSGDAHISHLVLRCGSRVVAAAQLRILRVPLIGRGVAYLRWGPMWRPRGEAPDASVFGLALQALRNEYVLKRRLSLRLLPRLFDDEAACFAPLLQGHGFASARGLRTQRTLLLPLGAPLAQLRAGQWAKWRNGLNQAERNGLDVQSGEGGALFAAFAPLHAQMKARKGYVDQGAHLADFAAMQPRLPASQKLHVWIASQHGEPMAGLIGSRLGDMGLYLFGATADAGLKSKASYLLQWHVVAWLKQQGARLYNLHGIDPLANPGTHRFKAGLAGAHGLDRHYLGGFDQSPGRTDAWLWRLANDARSMARAAAAVPRRFGRAST